MSGPFPHPDATTVDVGGVPLRVRVSGPEDGVPILLIHGIARSLEDWNEAQDLLAVDRRVISTDLPGFGYSRRGRERPGLPAFGRAMVGLLDALGIEAPVHVMGNSLGGGVAMTLAVDHPGRVASVTLVNSVGFGSEVNISPLPMTYGALAALPGLAGRFGAKAREAGAETIRDLFYDRTLATTEQFRHAGKLAKQADFRGTFLGTAATLGAPVVGVRNGWRRELLRRFAATGIPVFVVWGDDDRILPPKHFEAAAAALPKARTHLFVDAGHMPQVEKAEEFAALVGAFVDQVDEDSSVD
ncbi:pimeloyl-ACP methyl ester carboxylesterase [Marmoricola sp. OAE513]|uniref:alpha/beta fold hydrolase n=1 Tax=Marmoricola sp. OAE513 TaxID=2817894 RepID=UPI001AE5CCD2